MVARRRPEWMTAQQFKAHWQRCDRARKAGLPEPSIEDPFYAHGGDRTKKVYVKPGQRAPVPKEIQDLVDLTRRVITFEDLCDKMNRPPGQVRRLLEEAKVLDIQLELGQEHLQPSLRRPSVITHFVELDPYQLVMLSDLMDTADRAGQIPAGKGMAWASLRQQLVQPKETRELIQNVRAQAMQEFIKAAQPGPGLTPLPTT